MDITNLVVLFTHLISSDLDNFIEPLNRTCDDWSHGDSDRAPWSDPVCRGCDQSQCAQFGWNEVRWDEM